MRFVLPVLLFLLLPALPTRAAEAKVKKVLIQFLDKQGRHTTDPSLYERDAYQAFLRAHPEERSAVRAAVHWKGPKRGVTLRVQFRGTKGEQITTAEVNHKVTPRRSWARWDQLVFTGEDYQQFGELIAWRVTVWDGEQLLAEQRSFLW